MDRWACLAEVVGRGVPLGGEVMDTMTCYRCRELRTTLATYLALPGAFNRGIGAAWRDL